MPRLVRKVSLSVIFASTLGGKAHGEELKWTHFGLRPLGMGNAFVAVADDFNALFYNPAGLARLKTWSGELINPKVEISATTVQAIQDVQKLAAGSSGDSDAVLEFLEKNTGKTHHFALGFTPHLVFPGFGFGVGTDLSASIVVHRDITTDVDVGSRMIAPVSFATNLFEDRLSVGASIKAVAQGGIDRTFSINDIEAFAKNKDKAGNSTGPKLDDFVEGGTGVGADLGLLFTPVKTMQPTLGISVTDVGGTPFKKQNVQGQALAAPPLRLPSVNAGVSLRPWEAHNMYLLTAASADAINQPVHYSKKFNLGAEWGVGSIFKVQTGLHQGELSGGFEFDVMLFTCRLVTYTEQLGTVAGEDENLRDRRYALQLKLLI